MKRKKERVAGITWCANIWIRTIEALWRIVELCGANQPNKSFFFCWNWIVFMDNFIGALLTNELRKILRHGHRGLSVAYKVKTELVQRLKTPT